MKTRRMIISSVLGLGMAIALAWLLSGGRALAALQAASAPPAPGITEGSQSSDTVEVLDTLAGELHVCITCTYTTVQAAVDAAADGDVIKVAAGTYTGVLMRDGVTQTVYVSKTVSIRGGYTTTDWVTFDPRANPTTLDAEGRGRVFYVAGLISPTVVGLRVTGGDATGLYGGFGGGDAGGGMYIADATAVVSNVQVFGNAAHLGGGLYLDHSAATLSGNTINSNTITDRGGGVYLYSSDATLISNTIVYNRADGQGGGLHLRDGSATLIANTVMSNTASFEGGGLYLVEGSPTLVGNAIVANVADTDGGGLYLWNSDPTLSSNTIIGNRATLGGGLYVRESNPWLASNIVADNQVATYGSGLYVEASSPRLWHTTVARNTGGDGSGLYVTGGVDYSTVGLTNTILVSQTVGVMATAGNTATLEATLWGEGAWANTADIGGAGTILTGTSNFRSDPLFADPSAGDYHLKDGSGAIDNGVDTGTGSDVDLDLRPIGPGFDIGADEFPVVITTSQSVSTTLVYTDPQGTAIEIKIPAEAVTDEITLIYTPKDPQTALPLPKGLVLGTHVFDLDVYHNDVFVPHYVFRKVVTLTATYSDEDVAHMIESTLALYRGPGVRAEIVGSRPGESQTLDAENNVLTAYLLGTSKFREMGQGIITYVFVPIILRSG
jgi:parallel beta-helix repeat protein